MPIEVGCGAALPAVEEAEQADQREASPMRPGTPTVVAAPVLQQAAEYAEVAMATAPVTNCFAREPISSPAWRENYCVAI